jgi:hypothetical protein
MSSQANNKRLRFSKEEDIQLKEFILQYGENWNLIASLMNGKNSRQVRDRYSNYLSPSLNLEPWTIEEDELLKEKISEVGKKMDEKFTFLSKSNRYCIEEQMVNH